ncbi:hypothetical protein PoB_000891900 [Plakobranchus ocellatus]|uniref:Uncharacterized protein n=1 Tax=Plakobranchus ocellatus TaxID=259542 RepID=A0AAV3YJF6_9GAST|nr:hypothetical protein PoB_000891900 [Plakobranchus ocellatus]
MSCWALWQRLPPRYQLSTREPDPVQDAGLSSPHHIKSPRTSLSAGGASKAKDCLRKNIMDSLTDRETCEVLYKPTNAGFQGHKDSTKQIKCYPSRGKGRATMYFTIKTSPREESPVQTSRGQAAFPSRNSPFLTSFKQQQRINSARQNFVDPSTTPPASPRRNTPRNLKIKMSETRFPVTKIETYPTSSTQPKHDYRSPKHKRNSRASSDAVLNKTDTASKSAINHSSSALSVNTLLPVHEGKPFLKNPLYSEAKNSRYILKTAQTSSVIIDNDKVLVVKQNRAYPHSAPSSRESSANYLAHLRRLYLRDPKDFAKANRHNAPESPKKKLFYERLEYEKRTDSILNYYSRADDVELATAWASAVEFSRRPNTTPSTRIYKHRDGSKSSRPHRSPSRPTSARTRPNSARFPFELADSPPSTSSPRDALGDWNEFLKINSRSALHERQFYLRTPAVGRHGVTNTVTESPRQINDSTCRLCQVQLDNNVQDEESHAIVPQAYEINEPVYQEPDLSFGERPGSTILLTPDGSKSPRSYKGDIDKTLEFSDIGNSRRTTLQVAGEPNESASTEKKVGTQNQGHNLLSTNPKELQIDLRGIESNGAPLQADRSTLTSETISADENPIDNDDEKLKLEVTEPCSKNPHHSSQPSPTAIVDLQPAEANSPDAQQAFSQLNTQKDEKILSDPQNTAMGDPNISSIKCTRNEKDVQVAFKFTKAGSTASRKPLCKISNRVTQPLSSLDANNNSYEQINSDCDIVKADKDCESSDKAKPSNSLRKQEVGNSDWLGSDVPEARPFTEVVMDVKTGDFYVKTDVHDSKDMTKTKTVIS